jgi:hypothetical protein
MWTSKRDHGTLPLSILEVDSLQDGNAAMYQYLQRQPILLSGRKIAFR